jgi:hypothetical protein
MGPVRLIAAIRAWAVGLRLSPDAISPALAVTRRNRLTRLAPHAFYTTKTQKRQSGQSARGSGRAGVRQELALGLA